MADKALVERASARGHSGVLWLAVIDAVILAAGVASSVWFYDSIGLAGIATSLGLTGLVTFIAFWGEAGDIRTAIAAAVIITYFGFITVTFNGSVRDVLDTAVGKKMLDNFNDFVTLVITAYVGGKSIEKAVTGARGHDQASGAGSVVSGAEGSDQGAGEAA